jgi:hypothetical protein
MTWWFLSVLALVLGVPLSWWMFYKSVFSSAQTDGATYSYLRTFILIMLHMAWCVWMVLALPNLGSFSGGEHGGIGLCGWFEWEVRTAHTVGASACRGSSKQGSNRSSSSSSLVLTGR